MEYRICLHLVEEERQLELAQLVQKLLPPPCQEYVDAQDINFQDGWQCRVRAYAPVPGNYRVEYMVGELQVNDHTYGLNEIIFRFDAEGAGGVRQLLQQFLQSNLPLVLDVTNLRLRAHQLLGRAQMSEMPLYDEEEVSTVFYCHLPWHMLEVSKAWGDFLTKPNNRNLLRHLRVKLRRLRSSWSFCKCLLPKEFFDQWQGILKSWTTLLGYTREYDVALSTCRKIRQNRLSGEEANLNTVSQLELVLEELRQQQASKLPTLEQLNQITGQLAELMLAVYLLPLQGGYKKEHLRAFFRERLSKWCAKLTSSLCYPEIKNMERLHKKRIRIKRLRYALQGMPELEVPSSLMRIMKSLQDMLGLIHDDYVNALLIEHILSQHQEDETLKYQCAMFCGWERAKAEEALTTLPSLWENFRRQLADWQKETL